MWQAQSKDHMNPSGVWGWERKICPNDHCSALQGFSSDNKQWSWGTDFLSYSHTKYGFLILLTIEFLAHLSQSLTGELLVVSQVNY